MTGWARRALRRQRRRITRRAVRAVTRQYRRHPATTIALLSAVLPAGVIASCHATTQDATTTLSSIAGNVTLPTAPPETTEAPTTGPPATGAPDPHDVLAPLAINDHPDSSGYNRTLFMPGGRWQDTDGNGCDARKDALRAQSQPPITLPKCSTTGGHWPLVYVPGETSDPTEVDADHVVPLANAWRSGAKAWDTDRLVHYAADPAVLWIVDDGANQAKGDRGPEEWRPQVQDVWCTYARRWVSIKVTYGLTATTAERDALGSMLERCPS